MFSVEYTAALLHTICCIHGSFYFFPKSPIADDKAFIEVLTSQRVLGVPGSGFGCPGYFRLAFCVDESVIRNSKEGFAAARRQFA